MRAHEQKLEAEREQKAKEEQEKLILEKMEQIKKERAMKEAIEARNAQKKHKKEQEESLLETSIEQPEAAPAKQPAPVAAASVVAAPAKNKT